MLQAEELPARIANLNSALSDMDADSLTHGFGYTECFFTKGFRVEAHRAMGHTSSTNP